mmetsp:Transcript_23288/g.55014  ORF Transcript_23288/g.55014 Transcript_23288/m.55014 type:complete len:249 (-) Transcript_23288:1286-2032(-)
MAHFDGLGPSILLVTGYDVLTLAAFPNVPDRNTVPPPQLTRDAPIMDIGEPIVPSLGESLGYNLDVTILDSLERLGAHAFCLDEPLATDKRFNYFSTALRTRNSLSVRVDLDNKTIGLHIRPKLLPTIEAIKAIIDTGISVHGSVLVHDVDDWQIKLLSNGIIIGIMAWCNLKSTSTKLHINVFIGNNGDSSTSGHGDNGLLTNQMLVSLIVRVDANGCVAHYGLGSGSGNGQELFSAGSIHNILEEI